MVLSLMSFYSWRLALIKYSKTKNLKTFLQQSHGAMPLDSLAALSWLILPLNASGRSIKHSRNLRHIEDK